MIAVTASNFEPELDVPLLVTIVVDIGVVVMVVMVSFVSLESFCVEAKSRNIIVERFSTSLLHLEIRTMSRLCTKSYLDTKL